MADSGPNSSRSGRSQRWRRRVARAGAAALAVGVVPLVVIGVSSFLGLLARLPDAIRGPVGLLALPAAVAFGFGLVSRWIARPAPQPALPLRCPVQGRWRAMNGPATKVPSHGTHVYGQTYAIDLVHEPEPGARPAFGGRNPMRDPREYPAFGQPVYAPVDGRVVTARDRARDHRCRSNLLGVAYMLVEGMVLSLRGAAGPMGNHIVIQVDDDGTSVALAHLQRGSSRVAVGDEVEAGQVVAAVGNSGNTSEPHVHLQVMDVPHPNWALGVPFTFTDVVVGEAAAPPIEAPPEDVVPRNDAIFHAGGPAHFACERSLPDGSPSEPH